MSTPATPPEEPKNSRRQDDDGAPTQQKPSYKVGASDGGPGEWKEFNEGLSPEEAAYQKKVTGAPDGLVYSVKDPDVKTGFTRFDGYDPATNSLIDAKNFNKWPIDKKFSYDDVLEQARRQINAAKGTKIVWKVASPERAQKVSDILADGRVVDVTVEFLPP
ncbi:Tox-REase-5 domain-containing protein [Methylocystis heyeri]|uniref:Tox-REase-5 domain-containing protein n=1 Tax=Methylocystis heyeri TaxID=391905 RepID=UPI0024840253|nr:Tox-REase-5 domain-containing protein [Methylocystis heyeri]